MPFNGSGTYSLPAGNPVVTGTTISSTTTNNTNSDIATALSNCITRDGQSTPSANLPMNSKKLTGLAAGTTAGDSVRYEQIQYLDGVSSAGTSGYVLTSNGAGTAPSFQSLTVTGFLPLSGGTMTGAITFAAAQTVDGTNKIGYLNIPQTGADKTTAYTLVTGDVGKYVGVGTSGSIVVPTSTFANGDAISVYNNTAGNITITTSALTAYIGGTNTVKTSITLATRGIATILFVSSTVCVVTGNVS